MFNYYSDEDLIKFFILMRNWNPFCKSANDSNRNYDLLTYHQYEYGLYDEFGLQNMSVVPNMNNPRFVRVKSKSNETENDIHHFHNEELSNEGINGDADSFSDIISEGGFITKNVRCPFSEIDNILERAQNVFSESNCKIEKSADISISPDGNNTVNMNILMQNFSENVLENPQTGFINRDWKNKLYCCTNCTLINNYVNSGLEKATQTEPVQIISYISETEELNKNSGGLKSEEFVQVRKLINQAYLTNFKPICEIGRAIRVFYKTLLTISGLISVYFFLDYSYSEWILPYLNSPSYFDYVLENIKKIFGKVQQYRIKIINQ